MEKLLKWVLVLIGIAVALSIVLGAVGSFVLANGSMRLIEMVESYFAPEDVAAPHEETIPSTSVREEVAKPVDLNDLPANSIVVLSVAADAATPPWIEVVVDGDVAYAQITAPGTNLQWTITQTATLSLSNVDGVSVYVNGTLVAPAFVGDTYTLTLNVSLRMR